MNNNELIIFLYHEVNDTPSKFCKDFNLNVTPKLFRKQIEWIKNNYNIISPNDLESISPLPSNAALIAFDDGFAGAFDNGVSYLEKHKIPSIMFLNMGHIIHKTPLISSIAIYLSKYLEYKQVDKNYRNFKNLHLTFNYAMKDEFLKNNQNFDYSKIELYQGKLASLDMVEKFSKSKFLFYGNHLYNHWNSQALTEEEFKFNFLENQSSLLKYNNFINFFSFPNGQPNICFNQSHLTYLKSLGCKRVFYSSGQKNLNYKDYLLNRMDLTKYEYNSIKLRFRVLISMLSNNLLKRVSIIFRKFI
jgi:peptidoglycan/xylan/chitin deacetylase (PgdA/CDA1 family)